MIEQVTNWTERLRNAKRMEHANEKVAQTHEHTYDECTWMFLLVLMTDHEVMLKEHTRINTHACKSIR